MISNPRDFGDTNSPQSLALRWLIDDDSLYTCPDDSNLVQRYVMAVFYYSTSGDEWNECSAPTEFDSVDAIALANDACDILAEEPTEEFDTKALIWGTAAWLTPVSECFWGGVACDEDTSNIDRIEFRTYI